MRPKGSFDWLSKDIAVQLVKKMLVDPLNSVCQAMIQLLDCDDKWRYYLSSLRQNLFPNVASCENIKLEINGDTASFFSTTTLFKDIFATEENQTLIQGKKIFTCSLVFHDSSLKNIIFCNTIHI